MGMTLTGRMEKVFTAIRLEERRTILSGIEQSPPLFLNKTGYGNSPSWHTVQRDEIHFRIVEQHALLTTAKRPSFTCTYYLPPPHPLLLSALFLFPRFFCFTAAPNWKELGILTIIPPHMLVHVIYAFANRIMFIC